jgi:hypothetical protein
MRGLTSWLIEGVTGLTTSVARGSHDDVMHAVKFPHGPQAEVCEEGSPSWQPNIP